MCFKRRVNQSITYSDTEHKKFVYLQLNLQVTQITKKRQINLGNIKTKFIE